jgi:hypothetical protein
MGTLHLFGDSYTYGHNTFGGYEPHLKWEKFRGSELPPSWGELLSNKLDMNLSMNAVEGSSNDETFQTICKQCVNFKKNDIVIINWTYMHRFRWAIPEIKKPYEPLILPFWKRTGIANLPNDTDISEHTRFDIAINRLNPLYVEEIYDYENIIDTLAKSIGFNVYYWSVDNTVIQNLPPELLHQKKYILNELFDGDEYNGMLGVIIKNGGQTITQETNEVVNDDHFGEKGHLVQSELFYNYIIKTNSNG